MIDDELAVLASTNPKIQHVFVLMLENRSFDHMFALSGIPGIQAATANNKNSFRSKDYFFGPTAPDQMPTDPGHEFPDVVVQLCGENLFENGKPYPARNNTGFVFNYATTNTEGNPPQPEDRGDIMLGVDTQHQAPALYQLAKNYVLCDHWYSSLPGPTWPNRYFLHGASSAGLDHSPTSLEMAAWEAVDGFSYPRKSIFDVLKKGNYRLYQDECGPELGRVPQVSSIKGISFFDVENLKNFEEDLANGYTAAYTFIEPSYGNLVENTYIGGSSQHPMDGIKAGDDLAGRVYKAIRNSSLWPTSLLVILYDEHGGFYDSVPPGPAAPPNDNPQSGLNQNNFLFDVYGVRVPAIVISPWVAQGGVSHEIYDHSSVLATIERLFNIDPLTDRDGKAKDLLHLLGDTCRNDCLKGQQP